MDSGANVIYFERMNNSFLNSIEIAMLKAETSKGLPFSTKVLEELASSSLPGIVHILGIVTFEGGLPITTLEGTHIGSIGVSGASAEDDGICAQIAIDCIDVHLRWIVKNQKSTSKYQPAFRGLQTAVVYQQIST